MMRGMMQRATRSLSAVLAALVLATPVAAQVVTGTVTDSASGQPIPGAVIQLLDQTGEARGRGLSDIRGVFAVRATGTVSSVRVVRIGFRPSVTAITALPATGLRLDVAMTRIPAFLDPVRVLAAQCNSRRNRGRSPVALIEQARAGLLASVLTREQNPAAMTRLIFERTFAEDARAAGRAADGQPDQAPERQHVYRDSATQQTQSFRSARQAAAFVNDGFYSEVDGTAVFDAPDADVLLDDAFAAGYCFRVMPRDRSRPREVGLGFEPATRRDGRVDVEGALWIDTVARELRRLEFEYLGLNRQVELRRPGGSIDFRTLVNGLVIVERWQLRLIGAAADTLPYGPEGSFRVRYRYFDVHSGGELASAEWSDGTTWRATLGTATGRVSLRDGTPAAGVTLLLTDTPYHASTDSAGNFRIPDLLPGTYRVAVNDEALRSIGLSVPTTYRVVTARDSTHLRVTMPSRADVIADGCRGPGPFDPNSRAFVLGRALRTDGSPIEQAMWDVRINTPEGWMDFATNGRTGSDGLMPLCSGLRRGLEIEITARSPEGLVDVQRRRLTEDATIIPFVFPLPTTP